MSKRYSVVEVFPTIQGEGKWAGRAAVFMRFAGCNQWNGIPADRAKGTGACAMWCDTSFAKGKPMTIADIVTRLDGAWSQYASPVNKMVVITGGEPCLQLDDHLVKVLAGEGWFTAIETNGTIDNPSLELIDHICVSPKKGSELKVWGAHELKVVIPGGVPGAPAEHQWTADELEDLRQAGEWGSLYVQPQDITDLATVEITALTHSKRGAPHTLGTAMANARYVENVAMCIDFVQRHPHWRLGLQTHKLVGLH